MGEAKRRKSGGQPSPVAVKKKHTRAVVGGGAVALVAVILAVVWWVTRPPESSAGSLPDVAADAPPFPETFDSVGVSVGNPDAPVVVREFADYQCPACARFAPASKKLRETYVKEGKVRLVFFDLPLRQHEHAMMAAEAARCAGDQSSFWSMQDHLYEQQSEWSNSADVPGTFTRYADELGLDSRRLMRCVNTDLHADVIKQSLGVSQQLRVASTPTVLVDNIRLTRPGWAQMKAVIDRELAEQP